VLQELPRGARIRRADDLNDIAAVLGGLALEDLRPLAEVDFTTGRTTTARFETRDGAVITLDLVGLGDERWIRLDVPSALLRSGAAPPPPTAGWAYRVPSWKVSALQRRLADLVDSAKETP
jgi:hypothetical protein